MTLVKQLIKIIESPGGATSSGADGVLAGLFQQPA